MLRVRRGVPAGAFVLLGLGAGALGYLVKSEPVETIVEAIRAAQSGETYISTELIGALDDDGAAPRLSAQERRVMALYGAGQPVKAVAFQLGISEETAKIGMTSCCWIAL